MNIKNKKAAGHLIALGVVAVWGTTFIATKTLQYDFTVTQVMLMRISMALLLLTLIDIRHLAEPAALKEEAGFFLLSAFGITLYFLAENTALTLSTTANVSIIISAAPIFTAVLAHMFTKDEKLNRHLWFGFILAFAGVALVVFNGTFILKLNPAGDFLTILAALSWAVYSIMLKNYSAKYRLVTLTRKMVFYAFITILVIVLIQHDPFPVEKLASPVTIGCLMFLGFLGSSVCYILWSYAVSLLGVVKTNSYIYLTPFVTMICAYLILHEPVSIMGIIGTIMIIFGIVVSDKK